MLAGNADPDASYSDADSMLLNLNTNNAKNSLVIFCFVLKLFLIITAVKWLRFIAYTDADLSIRIIFFCCLKWYNVWISKTFRTYTFMFINDKQCIVRLFSLHLKGMGCQLLSIIKKTTIISFYQRILKFIATLNCFITKFRIYVHLSFCCPIIVQITLWRVVRSGSWSLIYM